MGSPFHPLPVPPPDEQTAAYLALVEAQLQVDWSAMFLGYHIVRSLRELRDQVRFRGWPRTFEERLNLSLIPYLDHDARSGGLDWAMQAPLHGPLAVLFDIDARTMNQGRCRAELSAAEFARYVLECRALFAEFSAIRARMHNGDP